MVHQTNMHLLSPSRVNFKLFILVLCLFLASLLLTSCYQPISPSVPRLTPPGTVGTLYPPTSSPSPSLAVPSQPAPSPSAIPPTYTIWLPPYLPDKMRASISFSNDYTLAASPENADIRFDVSRPAPTIPTIWIYALVAPFPTVTDGVTSDDLHSFWLSGTTALFNNAPLLVDESTFQIFSKYWGDPSAKAVLIKPAGELLDYAWANQPSWAIIPFESLEPRWKVLSVDEQSPIHKDFDPDSYRLSIPFLIFADMSKLHGRLSVPSTNRDASKLTTVALTGVTALVRATAFTMEQEGITYPAKDIGSLLAAADITHISNEIPFWPACPDPKPTMDDLVFCSKPSYIELLKAVGTDIIELTGDHFMDYGTDATLYTLQMYKDLDWPYYGGGANAEEARQPVKLENNGNRIAFMGCNVGCVVKNSIPCDATATDEHPGAALCDYNYIASEIPVLKEEGYNVIFTFQHNEYYTYTTEPDLRTDFGRVAADGATIVSGSQAHQAHGFSFQEGAFIHYGLGNLFFDQYHYCYQDGCDYAFIDRHIFYDGHYINTELITIRFVDFARPRLMTPEERAWFLGIIFKASGW